MPRQAERLPYNLAKQKISTVIDRRYNGARGSRRRCRWRPKERRFTNRRAIVPNRLFCSSDARCYYRRARCRRFYKIAAPWGLTTIHAGELLPALLFRGRRTSSPPQFGQTDSIPSVHSRQNVHSNVQINASPAGSIFRPHFSQADFISNAIVTFVSLLENHLSLA